MRLQIDARLIHGGGIGRYIQGLSEEWLKDPSLDRIRFLGPSAALHEWLAPRDPRSIAEVVPWEDSPYSPFAHVRWSLLSSRLPWAADVTFFPHYDVPLVAHPLPSVVTVHDLIQFDPRFGFPAWKRTLGGMLLRRVVGQASRVITISEVSRGELLAFAPAVTSKVDIVPNGVSSVFRGPTEAEAAETWRRDGRRPFVLTVGPAKDHKNLELAVRVVWLLRQEGFDIVHRAVGLREGDRGRLLRSIGVKSGDWLVDSLAVTDEELRALYWTATAVLHTSVQEGFGFVGAEALASGGYLLASDTPINAEVLKGAGRLLDPRRLGQWAGAVRGRLRDQRPESRVLPRRSGSGWSSAAQATLRALERASTSP